MADKLSSVLLLLNWRRRSIRASTAHYRNSEELRIWANLFTSFNLISAIAVLFLTNNKFFNGDSAVAGISEPLLANADFYTAIAGLLVVLTTALQYVLRFDEKSQQSKRAGNDFTGVKRRIELALLDDDLKEDKFSEIQLSHSHCSRNYGLVPKRIWTKAEIQSRKAFQEDDEFEASVRKKFGLEDKKDN